MQTPRICGQPNDLSAYWLPFTPNRSFKERPRLVSKAKGMHYTSVDGRKILDAVSGLWCVNAGHNRSMIVKAIQDQAERLDFASSFQTSHPIAFQLATQLSLISPEGLDRVFFTNSGSESVDTALKIALAWHKVNGEGGRTRLIGREKGYHGVNFGGTSVGGMVANRKMYGSLLAGVDHLPHTLLRENAFSRGLPEKGADLADALERIAQLHDPSTIAAVIVEPISCSGGVILPPKGYLERLRDLCTGYGILLIFDEVITGFGRTGDTFASQTFGVVPDMITTAKGLTNGSVPMGAVLVKQEIHDAFMQGPEDTIELFHGYTYSGHPLAAAAGLATLDLYRQEKLFARARSLSAVFEERLHSLRDCPNVTDIRNYGLVGAIDLKPIEGYPTKRAFSIMQRAFEAGILIRSTGDTLALSPPLIISESQIGDITDLLARLITEAA